MIKISPNITNPISIVETPILTPAQVGAWLNLSAGIIAKNTDLINDLIKTTTEVVEKYTWLFLRRTTCEAFFELGSDYFYSFVNGDLKLSLERAPILALADITKIEYLDENGVYVEFDKGAMTTEGLYENVTEKKEQRDWASIYLKESIPFDSTRINAYKIKVTFVAGFTIDDDPVTDIPAALKTAMLMIIASYYTNRGDCSDKGCSLNGYPIPCPAKSMIDQFSIAGTILGASYETVDNQPRNLGWGY
jgi:uncharacterized phiE125 gp8 family phage protein